MRCFVSIDLDPELREKIAEIQKKLALLGVKLVNPERLHITLKFLGELDEQQVKDVVHKLKEIKFSRFDIDFKGIGVFPDSMHIRVVWVGVESEHLQDLVKQVIAKLAEYRCNDFSFRPHLTLARVDRFVPGLVEKIEDMKDMKIGIQKVTNFRLKKSILARDGPIYSDIEVFEAM